VKLFFKTVLGMTTRGLVIAVCAAALYAAMGSAPGGADEASTATASKIAAALANIADLERPGQEGIATVLDGNKYVQCRQMADRTVRCEAGGAMLQPSLRHVLTSAKIDRLGELGWRLDPSFGNYVRVFPNGEPVAHIADGITQALVEVYDASLVHLDVQSDWIAKQRCPPRNGPKQDRAGAIEDPPPFPSGAIRACAYAPPPESGPRPLTGATEELIDIYGARVSGEIGRLRVNLDRELYVIFDTAIGLVQCATENKPPSIYCEAQSADAWPALAAVLTPDHVARLHAVGFSDPGRVPNYWKSYPLDRFDDAAIAREMLALLHDVYGYTGAQKLKILTETSSH
jgi:hypothetical protein